MPERSMKMQRSQIRSGIPCLLSLSSIVISPGYAPRSRKLPASQYGNTDWPTQAGDQMLLTIFKQFFLLGWISFGGPAAHLGYFRRTFVEQRQWLSDADYSQLVALSQFLPGPGSSQVGFAIGYRQAGLPGALTAFIGFTLPSLLLMLALAAFSSQLTDNSLFQSLVHGLKLLAVVIVADATLGMYNSFCNTRRNIGLCVGTAVALLLWPGVWTQISMLSLAALLSQPRQPTASTTAASTQTARLALPALLLFGLLLLILPLFSHSHPLTALFSSFFQAGSLVFGGGHVVLPLLQTLVGNQLATDSFLTGYAAAQAVPGPMFTFATYLGYALTPTAPITGALVATAAIFLPGFLLLLAVLKNWQTLAQTPRLAAACQGINAAVVGLLLSALYQPVFTSAVSQPSDVALLLIGFMLLKVMKLPIIGLVMFFILAGVGSGLL